MAAIWKNGHYPCCGYEFYCRICEIKEDDRFTIVDDLQESR